jgi:HEAT repeat protein
LTAQRAAWILGELKAREAVEALIGLVQNSQEMGLPESAIEALGKIGDDRAVEVLAELITSSYLPVRIKAVTALKEIGGHRALTVLKKALNDPSPSVSRSAREAIEALHSAEMGTASRYLATGRGRCVPISIGPWSLPAIFWSEEYQ